MAGINFVRRWVMGQMKKTSDDGIMITLPDKNKVDLNVNITMDRLLRNGIDPNQITSPQQVDNAINMINSRMVERAIPANSAEGREITEKLFGKQKAPVFDLEGNRIPEGSGIMGGKAVKDLMESGQVSKGARGMKKSKKVQDREMFQGANKRLKTEAQLKAEMEASNKKGIANIKNKRQLTEDEIAQLDEDIGGLEYTNDFDGTVGSANKLRKERADYIREMELEYKKGNLDPEPGSGTSQRKRFLQKKLEEAESSGDARLISREEREELFDLDDIPEYAKGGRIGFKGGADFSTVADSKGNVGAKSVSVSPSGSVTTSKTKGPDPVDDKGSNTQNLTQYLVNKGYTPKEIKRVKEGPNIIQKTFDTYNTLPFYAKAGINTVAPVEFMKIFNAGNVLNTGYNKITNPDYEEEDFTLESPTTLPELTLGMDPSMLRDSPYENIDPRFMADLNPLGLTQMRNLEKKKGMEPLGGDPFTDKDQQMLDELQRRDADPDKTYGPVFAADGGIMRANFVGGGMGRRGFLKMLAGLGGGIAAAKTGLLKFAGKEPAKQVAKEVVKEATSTYPPPYFFRLVEKIKFMGDDTLATTDKTIAKKYKDYTMEEDFAGNIEIIKKGDDVAEDVYMSYKVDEVPLRGKKGSRKVEEYEEYTARPDAEGKMKDIEQGVPDEVIDEAGDTSALTIKKASGGIARMLGE